MHRVVAGIFELKLKRGLELNPLPHDGAQDRLVALDVRSERRGPDTEPVIARENPQIVRIVADLNRRAFRCQKTHHLRTIGAGKGHYDQEDKEGLGHSSV